MTIIAAVLILILLAILFPKGMREAFKNIAILALLLVALAYFGLQGH